MFPTLHWAMLKLIASVHQNILSEKITQIKSRYSQYMYLTKDSYQTYPLAALLGAWEAEPTWISKKFLCPALEGNQLACSSLWQPSPAWASSPQVSHTRQCEQTSSSPLASLSHRDPRLGRQLWRLPEALRKPLDWGWAGSRVGTVPSDASLHSTPRSQGPVGKA